MLARVMNYCSSTSCFNHYLFQCQQRRVLQHPLLLSDLLQRLERIQQPQSRIHPCVEIGSEVTIRHILTHGCVGDVFTFQLVEPSRANPHQGLVSYLSPVGLALLALPLGAEFSVVSGASESRWRLMALNRKGASNE
ncbi:MAG: hypothetical protein COA51_11045 [Idiomarina sp.]|nr:MAG: hypothetical protein COA51_11045 [Idiomarina sp.]